MANQIMLKGEFRREQALASGAITPGHLLEQTSASTDTVKVHATEGDYAERMFAVEDALQGNIVSDVYADGALVEFNVVAAGAVVNAMIKAGEDIDKGDKLISAGDGTLIAEGSITSGSTVYQIVAYAVEAVDLSASGAANTLAAVRVL